MPSSSRGGCHRSLLNTNCLSGGFVAAPGSWGRRAGSLRGMCLSGQRPIGTRACANFSISLSSSLRPFQGVPKFSFKPRGKLSSAIACLALALWVGCSCLAGFQGLAPWSGPGIPSVREAPSALLLELRGKKKEPSWHGIVYKDLSLPPSHVSLSGAGSQALATHFTDEKTEAVIASLRPLPGLSPRHVFRLPLG